MQIISAALQTEFEKQISSPERRLYSGMVVVSDSGTAEGGTATTLSDTDKTWTPDEYIGYWVYITGGTGAGQIRFIIDNDATSLTIITDWTTNPGADSNYEIRVDKSDEVLSWASITRRADSVTSGNITLKVQNLDSSWNGILTTPEDNFQQIGELKIGYSSIGFLELFRGKLERSLFNNEKNTSLTFTDIVSFFIKKRIGSSEIPADYYSASGITVTDFAGGTTDDWSSGVNPAVLVWSILTYWGGLDSTESTANPDIDWTSFSEYKKTFDSMGYLIQAKFEGDSIVTALKLIAQYTFSTFYSESDGKIICRHWLSEDTVSIQTYSSAKWESLPQVSNERLDVINEYNIYYGYNPIADTFAGVETSSDATSKANYGTFDETFESKKVWFYDSASALTIGERLIYGTKNPYQEVEFTSYLLAYRQQLFDALKLTEPFYSWTDQGFRIEQLGYNLKDGTVRITGRLTTLMHFLILDHATFGTLDGYNVLA